MGHKEQCGEPGGRGLPIGPGNMDDRVSLMGTAHVIQKALDALQSWFDAEGDVIVEICECSV
jgi:hypothetical protein